MIVVVVLTNMMDVTTTMMMIIANVQSNLTRGRIARTHKYSIVCSR